MSTFAAFNASFASAVSAHMGNKPLVASLAMVPTAESGVYRARYTLEDVEGNTVLRTMGDTNTAAIEAALAKAREMFAGASDAEEVTRLEREVLAAEVALTALKRQLAAAKGTESPLANLKVPALDTVHGGRPATVIPEEIAADVRAAFSAGKSIAVILKEHGSRHEKLTASIVARLCEGIERKVKRAASATATAAAAAAPASENPAPETSVAE